MTIRNDLEVSKVHDVRIGPCRGYHAVIHEYKDVESSSFSPPEEGEVVRSLNPNERTDVSAEAVWGII